MPPRSAERRILVGLALVVGVVAAYATRQADPDLWGHLRYGRFFAEEGLGDLTDPFAYSSEGCIWRAHEWLAQWLLWQAYAAGGAGGLVLFKLLIGGCTCYFLYRALRVGSDDARIWVPLFLLAVVEVGRWFLFRPQLFTFCFFAYFLWVLLAHLRGKASPLWSLPVVLAFWANLHAGFLAGLGAIGLALGLRAIQAFQRTGRQSRPLLAAVRPLTMTLAVGCAATLLTPFGLELWQYVLTEMTHDTNRLYIQEWQPLLRVEHNEWAVRAVLLLTGALLFAGLLATLRGRRVADLPAWLWVLACAPLTWMAFSSFRHVPIFVLWTAPVGALLAQGAVESLAASPWRRGGWLAGSAVIGVITAQAVVLTLSDVEPVIRYNPASYPEGAAAFLRDNHLDGNVYAPLQWGSFLTWELYRPERPVRVAMDGRNVTLFPSAMVKKNLRFYLADGEDVGVPFHYPTDYLLVPRASPVASAVQDDSRWRELYRDEVAILLIRADERHADVRQENFALPSHVTSTGVFR